MATIEVDKQRVVPFCRRNWIRRLALFASVLRDDLVPGSDIEQVLDSEARAFSRRELS